MTTNRWYLGAMNDALFIIDAPPRPSTDDVWHDRPDGPKLSILIEPLQKSRAETIVNEHNKLVDRHDALRCALIEWAAFARPAADGNQEAIPKMAAADRKLLDFLDSLPK